MAGIGTLGSLQVVENFNPDGTKALGGTLALGFNETKKRGSGFECSSGEYITCGLPGGMTPKEVAQQFRALAALLEATDEAAK